MSTIEFLKRFLNIRVLFILVLSPMHAWAASFTNGSPVIALDNINNEDRHTLLVQADEQLAVPFETTSSRNNVRFRIGLGEFVVEHFSSNESHWPTLGLSIYDNTGTRNGGGDAPGNKIASFTKHNFGFRFQPTRVLHAAPLPDFMQYDYLYPNRKYWLVWQAHPDAPNSHVTFRTPARSEIPGSSGPWEIGEYHLLKDDSSAETRAKGWHTNPNWYGSNRVPQFRLEVTPEADNGILVVDNLDYWEGASRNVGGQESRRAISFFTRDNYYGATYAVKSVILHFQDLGNGSTRFNYPRTVIYPDDSVDNNGLDSRGGGFWFDQIVGSRDFRNRNVVRLGGNFSLKANTTYWITFDTRSDVRDPETGQDQSGSAYNRYFVARSTRVNSPFGWELGENEYRSWDNGNTWLATDNSPALQFGIEANRSIPAAFEFGDQLSPGNLGEENVHFPGKDSSYLPRYRTMTANSWVATRFWTISTGGSLPHKFVLNHVTMVNRIRNTYVPARNGTHVIAIYDDVRGKPGVEIARFGPDLPEQIIGDFPGEIPDDRKTQYRFHADPSAPIILDPWTGYWLIQKMEPSILPNVWFASFTESKHQEGWLIGDHYWRTPNRGRTWQKVDETHSDSDGHNWTMRFGFGATVISPSGDINTDGNIDLFDLILINDHISYEALIPERIFYLANLNGPQSFYITYLDRNLLLNMILER